MISKLRKYTYVHKNTLKDRILCNFTDLLVKIRKTTHSISRYLYNALQIQPQITSNNYAAELQNKYKIFF